MTPRAERRAQAKAGSVTLGHGPIAEFGDGHRRHPAAGAADDAVDGVDRRLPPAAAQVPARAFGDCEPDLRRHDEEHHAARQGHQPKGERVGT